jgi:hypothetical protein
MNLTPQGAKVAQYGEKEKLQIAVKLLRGEVDINEYVKGVCYDAAAFVKYLLGNKLPHGGRGITPETLITTSAQEWTSNLNSDTHWKHGAAMPQGSIITFRRLIDNKVFHAAVAIGMTSIRAVNGGRLGAGWSEPANLNTVLNVSSGDSIFRYDGTNIVVQVQKTRIPVFL